MRTILIAVAAVIVSTVANAKPVPVMKHGACPSGYHESGSYCTPMTPYVPAAIPKVGQCPSGFYQSGNYCIEMRRER